MSPRRLLVDLGDDLRYALRGLLRTPVVTAVAILSLAVGMAAVTSVFSIANALLIRPLSASMEEPDGLVAVFTSDSQGGAYGRFSFPDYEDLERASGTLEGIAVFRLGAVRIGDPQTGRRVFTEIVSGNYFDVLRVPMQVGRGFRPDETRMGAAERVAVVSDRLWRDELGGRPDAVGATLRIDGDPFTVVGVAPADLSSMTLAVRADLWLPVGIPGGVFLSDERELSTRTERDYGVLARRRPGAGLASISAELAAIAERLAREHGPAWQDAHNRPRTMTAMPAAAARVPPDAFPALASGVSIVLIGTALLLVVACANIAGVLLARAQRRVKEIAVRLALGAGRGRVARLVLTEGALIGLLASGPALLLTRWWIARFDSIPLPIGDLEIPLDLRMDSRVPAFALLLGLLAGLAFGSAPALHAARTVLGRALTAAGRGGGGHKTQRLRRTLVGLQVTAALMFVVGAGVASRSFGELVELPWGVDPEGVAVMSLRLTEKTASSALPALYRDLREATATHAGVAAAALSTTVEGGQFVFGTSSRIRAAGTAEPQVPFVAAFNQVSAGYMQMLDIRLVRGRPIGPQDDETSAPVAVINEEVVRRLWGQADPIGRSIVFDGVEHEVVGVAADGRYVHIDQGDMPYIWLALPQHPSHRVMLLAKGRPDAPAALPALRATLERGERDIIAVMPQPYLQLVNFQFGYLRVLGRLLAWAGAFGLLLATLGLYGIVAWAVEQRRHELAVRQAVGATPGAVVRMVLRDGLRLTVAGLLFGLLLIVPLSAVLRSNLGNVSALDLPSAVAGAAAVLVVATVATALPARRVTRIHPASSLRAE